MSAQIPFSPVSARALLAYVFLTAFFALLPAPGRAADAEPWADVLAAMSVEQKVGQLFCVAFRGEGISPETGEFIEDLHVGGLILYDKWGNVRDPGQVARLCRDAQRTALASGHPGLFMAVDQEGGPVARLRQGFAVPPSNMAAGASGDPKLAALGARVTAQQLLAVGLNVNFAPAVDVNSNPANPIIGVRSFGETPQAVARFAAAAVRAYGGAGILSVAKHFPGHGDTGMDSHLNLPVAPHARQRLDAVELPPFAAAIRAGVPAVMTAHVEVPALEPEPGLPATLSRRVLTDLLRGDLGFDGLIFTDSMGMGAVKKHFGTADAALRAFSAGADVLLYGADKGATPRDFVPARDRLVHAVRRGEIPMRRLDESVARILRAKQRFGLLSPTPPAPERAASLTNTPDQRAAVRTMARAGLVLGRDYGDRSAGNPVPGGLPPLAEDADVLLLWPHAPAPFSLPASAPKGLWAMPLPRDPTPEDTARALDASRAFDAVIVFTDRADKHPAQAALVNAFLDAGQASRLAVVSLNAPYDIRLFPAAPCWLAAFSATPASVEAALDALYGRFSPRGKLPVEIRGIRNQ